MISSESASGVKKHLNCFVKTIQWITCSVFLLVVLLVQPSFIILTHPMFYCCGGDDNEENKVCTELTNENKWRCRLTSALTNRIAEGNAFRPAHFPVQGDCFGELKKVHWNRLKVLKRWIWEVIPPFERFSLELDTGVIIWNCQRLFSAVKAVSLLFVKLHCWR